MKRMIITIVAVCLTLSLSPIQQVFANSDKEVGDINSLSINVKDVKFDSNKDLTKEEVDDRLDEIFKKYDVNEPFSDEDAEFIRAHVSPTSSQNPDLGEDLIELTANKSFNTTRTVSGITANFGGTIYDFNGDGLSNSFRANARLRVTHGNSKVDKLSMEINMKAVGLIGHDGKDVKLGVIFNRTEKPSTTTSQLLYDRTFSYSGVVWYTEMSATGIVTHSGGSQFDLN